MNSRPRSAKHTKVGLRAAVDASCQKPPHKTPQSVPKHKYHPPTPCQQHRTREDIKDGKALNYQKAAEWNLQFEPLTPWEGQSSQTRLS